MNTVNRKTKIIVMHIAALVVFIGYDMGAALIAGAKAGVLLFLPYYVVDVLLFYVVAYLLYPKFISRENTGAAAVLSLALLLVYCMAVFGVTYCIYYMKGKDAPGLTHADWGKQTWRGLYIYGLAAILFFFRSKIQKTKEANNLKLRVMGAERDRATAENAYRQLQMNPHLLFNVLNFIYNALEGDKDDAAEAVQDLADMMRYAFERDASCEYVSLDKELLQVDRLIGIKELLNGKPSCFIFEKDLHPGYRDVLIPPLTIVTLVENIFKHGLTNASEDPARIKISTTTHAFNFRSSNLKLKKAVFPSTGTGLKNLSLRLEHVFGSRYTLAISENETHFELDLTIRL